MKITIEESKGKWKDIGWEVNVGQYKLVPTDFLTLKLNIDTTLKNDGLLVKVVLNTSKIVDFSNQSVSLT